MTLHLECIISLSPAVCQIHSTKLKLYLCTDHFWEMPRKTSLCSSKIAFSSRSSSSTSGSYLCSPTFHCSVYRSCRRNILERTDTGFLHNCTFNRDHQFSRFCPIFVLSQVVKDAGANWEDLAVLVNVSAWEALSIADDTFLFRVEWWAYSYSGIVILIEDTQTVYHSTTLRGGLLYWEHTVWTSKQMLSWNSHFRLDRADSKIAQGYNFRWNFQYLTHWPTDHIHDTMSYSVWYRVP